MVALKIILLCVFGIGAFILIKSMIVYYSAMGAAHLITMVKLRALGVGELLTDELLDILSNELQFEKMLKNPLAIFLCPWIWTTKQCFQKGKFALLVQFYNKVQSL